MPADVAWVPIAGIWVRQSRPGVRGDEPSRSDARWQRAKLPAAYFADSEATAWAELYRGLAERGLEPGKVFPRDLHHVRIELERVADLSREKARRALGLPRMNRSQAAMAVFQDSRRAARGRGCSGRSCTRQPRGRGRCACAYSRLGSTGLTIEG